MRIRQWTQQGPPQDLGPCAFCDDPATSAAFGAAGAGLLGEILMRLRLVRARRVPACDRHFAAAVDRMVEGVRRRGRS